eukprot:scaffold86474_cov39-Prasinocladus_malaysianus.AAC.1
MAASPALVAALVEQYLLDFGYDKSLEEFRKEGGALLRLWGRQQHQRGKQNARLKDLGAIVADYAAQAQKDLSVQRASACNPLLRDIQG